MNEKNMEASFIPFVEVQRGLARPETVFLSTLKHGLADLLH